MSVLRRSKKMLESYSRYVAAISLLILPAGFVRIRHYGILSATSKKVTILLIREQYPETVFQYREPRMLEHFDPKICPCCGKAMVIIESILPRGYRMPYPPTRLLRLLPLFNSVFIVRAAHATKT